MYFGGDTIQNVSYSTEDSGKQARKGFFRNPQVLVYDNTALVSHRSKKNVVNDLGIVSMKRKVGPNGKKTKEFEHMNRGISELIADAVKKTNPTREQPLVIFSTQCRSTSDEEIYQKCYQQDVIACRRLGKDIPQGIPQTLMKKVSVGHHFFGYGNNHTKFGKRSEIRRNKKQHGVKSYTPF